MAEVGVDGLTAVIQVAECLLRQKTGWYRGTLCFVPRQSSGNEAFCFWQKAVRPVFGAEYYFLEVFA